MSVKGIDPRGPRVGATITSVFLAVVVLFGSSTAGLWLLTFIMLSFLLGTLRGAEGSWQGMFFKKFIRPRLDPPAEMEDRRPPRFAQSVGLFVTAVGVILGFLGVPYAVPIAAGVAFIAAALNAVTGMCLGCEMYLLLRRAGLVKV